MSLTRNTARGVVAALCAAAVVLPIGACGRDEADLANGKATFVEKCGSCHELGRAGTAGQTGPSLDAAFQTALADGMDRDTVKGIVHDQILYPREGSQMPAGDEIGVTGDDARDVSAYVGYAAARSGDDEGALATAGLAQATSGEQIFTAAGCAGCHTFAPAGSNANIGPSLDDLASAAGDRQPGTSPEDYVRESITNPEAFLVEGFGNAMPAYEGRLTDEQLQAITEYLLQTGGN